MFVIKKIFIIFLLVVVSVLNISAAKDTINAENNAYLHNNTGLEYLKSGHYSYAIKEFQIAIALNPDTQATAVYYYNLGNTYNKIGQYNFASNCFEKASSINPLYFEYYLKMVYTYKLMGVLNAKLAEYRVKPYSPLNNVVIGLIYIEKGDKSTGITILDDFCNSEPNLIITIGIKTYLKKITNQ